MAPKSEEVPVANKEEEKKKPKKLTKEELEKKREEDELSDEDKQLKEELKLCVTRLSELSHYFSLEFSLTFLIQPRLMRSCGARRSPR